MLLHKDNTLCVTRGFSSMSELDEERFEIIKRILEEFPQLREKVKKWLQENPNDKVISEKR